MKRLWWLIMGGLTLVGLGVIGVLLIAPKSPLPLPIVNQVTSMVFVPQARGVEIIRDSAKYDAANKLLTYNVAYGDARLVVSEQPTPEQFVDIPEVYEKLISGMNNYQSFDSAAGTVHLTKPSQLGDKQAAVLNTKGTLTFVKPDKNLTADQWRLFFNHFQATN